MFQKPAAGRAAAGVAPVANALRLLLAAALLLNLATLIGAQRPYPLPGADGPFPVASGGGRAEPFDINTTVLLERVTNLDEEANGYGAIWWVIFSWRDANAGAQVAVSTAAAMQPNGSCNRWCDSGQLASMGCCDGIWLPHIELLNLVSYIEDQQPRWRINANATSGTVTWSTRLVGTWYAPLDFRAYPFDHQHILLELAIADSQSPYAGLRWEHVAKMNNTAHTKGPDLSGWRIRWAKGKVYDSRRCFRQYGVADPRYATPQLAAASAPNSTTSGARLPPPGSYESVGEGDRHFADNREIGTTEPEDCGYRPHVYEEARALYGPVVLVADFMIKRVASYYVLTNLVPVLLITMVAFVVYFMPQNALGDRMSVVLTMFLSLTAMQFVFDFPPANYINALQMVVLVSYIMIAIACVECLIVNRIATVADAVSIKRSCVSKYSGLLAGANFEGYLKRELSAVPGGAGAAAAAAGSGVRHRAGRVRPRSAVARRYTGGGTAAAGAGAAPEPPSKARAAGREGAASSCAGEPVAANGSGDGAGNGTGAAPSKGEGASIEVQPLLLPKQQVVIAIPDTPHGATPAGPEDATRQTSSRTTSPLGTARTASRATAAAAAAAAAVAADNSPAGSGAGPGTGGGGGGGCLPCSGAAILRHRSSNDSAAGGDAPTTGPAEGGGSSHSPGGAAAACGRPAWAGGAAHMPSAFATAMPFASARSHVSFAISHTEPGATDEVRSVASSRGSAVAAGVRGVFRRCFALGPWASVRAFFVAAGAWLAAVAAAPGRYYRQCKEDHAFARYTAARIDKWCCIVCFTLYFICITVLLWVETKVGDHKLMLGDRPGNM